MFRLILTVASSIFSQEVRRHLADFCQGTLNSELVDRIIYEAESLDGLPRLQNIH